MDITVTQSQEQHTFAPRDTIALKDQAQLYRFPPASTTLTLASTMKVTTDAPQAITAHWALPFILPVLLASTQIIMLQIVQHVQVVTIPIQVRKFISEDYKIKEMTFRSST